MPSFDSARTLALLPFFFAAACTPPTDLEVAASERAIIGGAPVGEGEHPAAGFLWIMVDFDDSLFPLDGCSATLIAEDVVLTAAHCVVDFPGFPPAAGFVFTNQPDAIDAFRALVTPIELVEGSYASRGHVAHPDFSIFEMPPEGLDRTEDIALVFLDEPVTGITPAALPEDIDQPALSEGTEVSIVGYGVTSADGGPSGGLGRGFIVKHGGETQVTEVGSHEIRVGRTSPDDPLIPQKCSGDSGGPSFVERPDLPPFVVGVTSRPYDQVENCNSGGVDIRVDAYLEWLKAEMDAACAEGRRPGPREAPCGESEEPGGSDGGSPDMGSPDVGSPDVPTPDAGPPDGGVSDVGPDAGAPTAPPTAAPLGDEGEEGCTATGEAGGSLWVLLGLLGLFMRRREGR
jgi:MYXO-CTERM domain-containing protein